MKEALISVPECMHVVCIKKKRKKEEESVLLLHTNEGGDFGVDDAAG